MAGLRFVHGLSSPYVLIGMNGVVALSGAATLPRAPPRSRSAPPRGCAARSGVRAACSSCRSCSCSACAVVALGVAGWCSRARPGRAGARQPPRDRAPRRRRRVLRPARVPRCGDVRPARRRRDLVVVVGIVWLAASLVAALPLRYDELGWWLGHGFEVVGILFVGAPGRVRPPPRRTLRPLLGDLSGAELVAKEEAFLGADVHGLTRRLAEKDAGTETHTRRVALLAVQVGEELGLPAHRLRHLAMGGLLHDIGKLGVPDAILKKPGPLDDDEFREIQRHPVRGDQLLGELGFGARVRRLVLDHHERLDGKGYPRGLGRRTIDLDTKILTVCDVYDALISPRVYRPAFSEYEALELIRSQTGTAFDPRCVDALERVLGRETSRAPAPELSVAAATVPA